MSNDIRLGWPVAEVYEITQDFGNMDVPTGAPYKVHYGVDIATPVGTPVEAVASGTVTFAGEDRYAAKYQGGYGLMMIVSHDNGVESYYCHLSACLARPHQAVQPGMTICKTGNSGFSTGPHLHYGVMVNGEWVDPQLYRKSPEEETAELLANLQVVESGSLFRVVCGCRIRLLPDVSNDLNICGWLADGLRLSVQGVADVGNGNLWAQLDEEGNRWCAIYHDGWRYLEGINSDV